MIAYPHTDLQGAKHIAEKFVIKLISVYFRPLIRCP